MHSLFVWRCIRNNISFVWTILVSFFCVVETYEHGTTKPQYVRRQIVKFFGNSCVSCFVSVLSFLTLWRYVFFIEINEWKWIFGSFFWFSQIIDEVNRWEICASKLTFTEFTLRHVFLRRLTFSSKTMLPLSSHGCHSLSTKLYSRQIANKRTYKKCVEHVNTSVCLW